MRLSKTVVISCAGMGSRLGLNKTKALIPIEGKTIIARQLEMLKSVQDVRVVVGYQSEEVINEVLKIREDAIFVFNHDYKKTGTGASFCLGAKYANEMILSLDGDLLVHPEDMNTILNSDHEFVCGYKKTTENPVFLQTKVIDHEEMVNAFSKKDGNYEWTGLVQLKNKSISATNGHVYYLIEPLLPLKMLYIRAHEIDTMEDYKKAVAWVSNNYQEMD